MVVVRCRSLAFLVFGIRSVEFSFPSSVYQNVCISQVEVAFPTASPCLFFEAYSPLVFPLFGTRIVKFLFPLLAYQSVCRSQVQHVGDSLTTASPFQFFEAYSPLVIPPFLLLDQLSFYPFRRRTQSSSVEIINFKGQGDSLCYRSTFLGCLHSVSGRRCSLFSPELRPDPFHFSVFCIDQQSASVTYPALHSPLYLHGLMIKFSPLMDVT